MSKVFISHSSKDDVFVGKLRKALHDHGIDGWIDSRELRGGDPLLSEIQDAIRAADGVILIVSPDSFQSKWCGKELKCAIQVQKERGKDEFRVIPLALDDTNIGIFEDYFDEEPIYISISTEAGGIEASMNDLLVALGKRKKADIPVAPPLQLAPLEELILELTNLNFQEENGVRRAIADAELIYQPASKGKPAVHTAVGWHFVAPIGPIEAGELTWYLEKYSIWPNAYFQERATKVEKNLAEWGQLLYKSALPAEHTLEVLTEWRKINELADRRFSVHVKPKKIAGAKAAELDIAKEAATSILALPWELMHDGKSFLFQGGKPTRVRRRMPATKGFDVPVVATPIRILLITARPEDKECGYIDHRASALPLVDAMEQLPGLVELHVLSPATQPALEAELARAQKAGTPYHVVHFDGHGVFDKHVGLGGLCFEHPEDEGKIDNRRHILVYTDALGPLLEAYRIPLVFLEACQTASAEKAADSVAAELLQVGVASVVAMSHSVLVETARMFVGAFYKALAHGKRVGDAMLAGQRYLKQYSLRGYRLGAGALRLQDWFVPVLFQEKEDPHLFTAVPAKQTLKDARTALKNRMGQLPKEPATGFIGRSRDLLALQRMLSPNSYVVIRGQGGEGKTTIAVELARWLTRTQVVRRVAFVSVEKIDTTLAVLDAIGHQLVGKEYTVAKYKDLDQAIEPVARALREQATLLVIDNMESILLKPYATEETPEALGADAAQKLNELLEVCTLLNHNGDTRLVFTSREWLPAPFDAQDQRRELHRLDRTDAVALVERVLNDAGGAGATTDASREEIEQLVGAVHGHARTLALLAPSLRETGVKNTREQLAELMAQMHTRFPKSREQSLFASLELSLQRLSVENQERVKALAPFQGGFQSGILAAMIGWETADAESLAEELVGTGLATANNYNHFSLNPALCPYLRGRIAEGELKALTARWVDLMRQYASYLDQQRSQDVNMASALAMLELPNLMTGLEAVATGRDATVTIAMATDMYSLIRGLGKPTIMARIGEIRDVAAKKLDGPLSHVAFDARRTRVEQQLATGQLREALAGGQQLLEAIKAAGPDAYPGADYDLAMAHLLLARVWKTGGQPQAALPLLDEAQVRFEAIQGDKSAEGMASVCLTERGDCLRHLGQYDDAVVAYEGAMERDRSLGDQRGVAVGMVQIGTVRLYQKRYDDALAAYAEARSLFSDMGEPGTVAATWHQTGMTYEEMGVWEAAEDAYRQSLAIQVQQGNLDGQASTLGQLGNLYKKQNKLEEALGFYQKAIDIYFNIEDSNSEGLFLNNMADGFLKLNRLSEARDAIKRAIKLREQFGHAAEPWKSWHILSDIETADGDNAAAREARGNALASYLAYRQDGGENYEHSGRIAHEVRRLLQAGDVDGAREFLAGLATDSYWVNFHPFIQVLQAVLAGKRDAALADGEGFTYMMAAEVLLLMEELG